MNLLAKSKLPGYLERIAIALVFGLLQLLIPGQSSAENKPAVPLKVCATVPDLGDLVSVIGGESVQVTTFVKPTEDPHFIQAKPSFVKLLSEADLLVLNGLDLELGWIPVLLQGARNPKIRAGEPGYLDASEVVAPLEVAEQIADRSHGDVHPRGNPHYLVDPVNGLRVARFISKRLSELLPEKKNEFASRLNKFESDLSMLLIGSELTGKYDLEKLMTLAELGKLKEFLESQGELAKYNGILRPLLDIRGTEVVADHNLWPYFAKRIGFEFLGFLEPKPGIPPTTKHLKSVIESMRLSGVRVILANPYYDSKHAEFVAGATDGKIAQMAHQVGSRPGINSYLSLCRYNIVELSKALGIAQ